MAGSLRVPSTSASSLDLSPPCKRHYLFDSKMSFSGDDGDLDEIFPSDEDDTDCTSERAFYPSDAFSVMTAKNTPADEVTTVADNEDHPELQRIGCLLIGKCCSKLCLRNLTATDIISAKVDYLSQTSMFYKIWTEQFSNVIIPQV